MTDGPTPDGSLDIKALLSVALEQEPSSDISDRVMDRVALMETLVEFARLVGAAPFHWLGTPTAEEQDEDQEHHDDEHEADDELDDAPR